MKKAFLTLLCVGIAFSKPLSYEEIKQLGREASKSLLEEYQPKNKPTLIISNINNEAGIDIDLLTLSITRNIRKSGQYNLLNNKESMLKNARGLRDDEEYNPETVIEKGELLAPNLSLSGEVSKQTQDGVTTYLLLLTLTDIKTGLLLWDKDIVLTQKLDDSIQISTSTPPKQNPQPPKEVIQSPKKEERTSFFLLGIEGGLGAGIESSLSYFGGAKLGYTYAPSSFFSLDIYGLYEFYNRPTLENKKSKKRKSKYLDDDDDEINFNHALGAGARAKLSILYVGANFLYDLKDSQTNYLFDAGFSFKLGIINLNIGARYTLAPSQIIKNQFSGVVGIDFNL